MKILFTFFVSFFITLNYLYSQETNIWSIIFGSEEFTGLNRSNTPEDLVNRICEASDGSGFYISGTNNHSSGTPKPNTMGTYVAKFDVQGKLLWWNCASTELWYYDNNNIAPSLDGGIITTGNADRREYITGKSGIVLFKHDGNGKLIFEKTIEPKNIKTEAVNVEKGSCPLLINELSHGVFKILTKLGTRVEFKRGNMTVSDQFDTLALITYDYNTDKVFVKFQKENMKADLRAVATKDKGIAMYAFSGVKLYVWKYNQQDELEWKFEKEFSCDYTAWMSCNENNELLINLYSMLTPECKDKNLILVLNKSGKEILSFKSDAPGYFGKIYEKNNMFFGAYSDESDIGKFVFQKFSKDGKVIWKKKFGQKKTSAVSEIIFTKDNGFAILAGTEEFGAQYIDAWIIKTDSLGNTDPLPKKYKKK